MQVISTTKAPAAIGPYSQAIVTNGLFFSSGQIPIVPETGLIKDGDIKVQTEQVIHNIFQVLNAVGGNFSDVIKTTCFLKNMSDFAEFNEVYGKYFINKPARSCVEVAALPKGALVEIEFIATVNEL